MEKHLIKACAFTWGENSLKCLWSEICFCLVLKFTLSNTWFQSLRHLALTVTILQAVKIEPFCSQKWSLNCAVKIPRDTNLWRHFGAKIILTMADRWRRGNREGDIVQPVPQTSKVAKTQHSRWVYECISFPQIRLFERNGSRLSEDTDTTSRIRHQNMLWPLYSAHFEESSYKRRARNHV